MLADAKACVIVLKIRRPPRSTRFPSTSLSRSGLAAGVLVAAMAAAVLTASQAANPKTRRATIDELWKDPGNIASRDLRRSEEHTSELQSRQYLVCRLLLEKKSKRICNNAYIVH